MTLNSATVAAWDPALAADWNNLRKDLLQKAGDYATTTGSANAFLLTIDAQITAYTDGLIVACKTNFAPTGALTININGIGVANVKTNVGNAVYNGYIPNGQPLILRYNGTDFIVQNYQDLSTVGQKSVTASGNIAAGDIVYPTAADTVKTIYPSAITTSAITTSATTFRSARSLRISDDGRFLHVVGGGQQAGALVAQVRTLNAWETDFANGTEVTIFSTSNGTRYFDICEIDTNKWLCIYQKDNGGAAGGIACKVLTLTDPTTLAVGAEQVIESTGGLTARPTCSKLNTDKALISYQKDSDGDLYCQVLTVSTTTIATNTPALVRVCGASAREAVSCQLSTDTVAIAFSEWGANSVYWFIVTVSTTTPSVWAQQTLYAIGSNASVPHLGIVKLNDTKVLVCFGDGWVTVSDLSFIVSISGATMTPGSTYSFATGNQVTDYFGMVSMSADYALVGRFSSNTNIQLNFLNLTSGTPVLISATNLAITTTSNNHEGIAIAKVRPWVYNIQGGANTDADYLIKLTPISSAFVGVAESAISDTATGNIRLLGNVATLTGLTAASAYYSDESGQVTTKSSLTAVKIGVSLSTTQLLLTS